MTTNTAVPSPPWVQLAGALLATGAGATAGIAAARAAFVRFYAAAPWLNGAIPVLLLALLGAGLALWWWRAATAPDRGRRLLILLPLYLNLLVLAAPAPRLPHDYFLPLAALWLSAGLWGMTRAPRPGLLLSLVGGLFLIYLLTLGQTVGAADTFEFQVVIPRLGIVHPTGYPLYLLLSKPFTWLPLGSVAWRINLGTALWGVAACCLVALLLWRLTNRPVAAAVAGAALGLSPAFWRQAVAAEVYTLHALIVAAALLLMGDLLRRYPAGAAPDDPPLWRRLRLLALLLGLGLTNHLTTVFLLPPAAFTTFLLLRDHWRRLLRRPGWWGQLLLLFLAPLLLYLYLPLRWQAVNGEPMGAARFFDWVVAGRFQGALQWEAWLQDSARYGVVGGLFQQNWGDGLLLLATLGWLWLLWRRRRMALILLLTWAGFTFYCLNYYVPDLDVFLLPAQLVIAICLGASAAAVADGLTRYGPARATLAPVAAGLLLALLLAGAAGHWASVDDSGRDGLTTWGQAVLAQPLPDAAAILADSEKIAPLYYLQQAEGIRPDLDIAVLPDEAAYRNEISARLAAGQPVYLARYLPNLAGQYRLRAQGPLALVNPPPLTALPAPAATRALEFGPLRLLGYQLDLNADADPGAAAVTYYWQRTDRPAAESLLVFNRWLGPDDATQPWPATGRHPVHDLYPTAAWQTDEIVTDFYLLPRPTLTAAAEMTLQVAVAPAFTPAADLPWQDVTTVPLPATTTFTPARPLRLQVGAAWLDGITVPAQVRPQTALPVTLTGCGDPAGLALRLAPWPVVAGTAATPAAPACAGDDFVWAGQVATDVPAGSYALLAAGPARCGWLAPATATCMLARVEVSGVPLPAGAVNFDDQIALLDLAVAGDTLQPGGQLDVTFTWQSLGPMDADYTVFVQLLDESDRLVAQIDSWPRQGTYPTSAWAAGEVVTDPYQLQLPAELPPGTYRLIAGWYLLGTPVQRLPVLDGDGQPVDDRVVVDGLTVP